MKDLFDPSLLAVKSPDHGQDTDDTHLLRIDGYVKVSLIIRHSSIVCCNASLFDSYKLPQLAKMARTNMLDTLNHRTSPWYSYYLTLAYEVLKKKGILVSPFAYYDITSICESPKIDLRSLMCNSLTDHKACRVGSFLSKKSGLCPACFTKSSLQ